MSRVHEQFSFIYNAILVIHVEIFRHLTSLVVQNMDWSEY
jgi:hypothetical protein